MAGWILVGAFFLDAFFLGRSLHWIMCIASQPLYASMLLVGGVLNELMHSAQPNCVVPVQYCLQVHVQMKVQVKVQSCMHQPLISLHAVCVLC